MDKEVRRYDQPFFCVTGSKGKFKGVHFNHLSPLELPEETRETRAFQDTQWTARQWDIINQLRGEVKHIHKDLHELQAKRKKIDYY